MTMCDRTVQFNLILVHRDQVKSTSLSSTAIKEKTQNNLHFHQIVNKWIKLMTFLTILCDNNLFNFFLIRLSSCHELVFKITSSTKLKLSSHTFFLHKLLLNSYLLFSCKTLSLTSFEKVWTPHIVIITSNNLLTKHMETIDMSW